MPAAASYAAGEVMRDGRPIRIRAIRPDDKQRLLEHFAHLSPRSVYYRFFGLKRSLDDQDLRRFTELDFVNHVGLVATVAGRESATSNLSASDATCGGTRRIELKLRSRCSTTTRDRASAPCC